MPSIAELEVREAAAREAFLKAQSKWNRVHDMLTRARKTEEAKEAMNLTTALEAYLPSGWNERGYNFLTNLTWKGEWYKTGLRATGGHWSNTKQQQVKVAITYGWDDAKLAVLAELIGQVIGIIRPGMYEGNLKLLSKGSSVDATTLRCLSIFEHDLSQSGDWSLGLMEDGEWVVFDGRMIGKSYGRARFVGTLTECLREIANHLWYDGGPYNSDDD